MMELFFLNRNGMLVKLVSKLKKSIKKRYRLKNIKKIAFLYDREPFLQNDYSFDLIFSELNDDYKIKMFFYDFTFKERLESFDLILLWTTWRSPLERKFRFWNKSPTAIYVRSSEETVPFISKFFYRSIWVESFDELKNYKRHPNVHFGVCLSNSTRMGKNCNAETEEKKELRLYQDGKIRSQSDDSLRITDIDFKEKILSRVYEFNEIIFPDVITPDLVQLAVFCLNLGKTIRMENNAEILEKVKQISQWNSLFLSIQFRKGVESISDEKIYITNIIKENKNLVVGRYSFHRGDFNILGQGCVEIGSFNAFGNNIKIITENHDYNFTAIQGFVYRYYFNQNHPGAQGLHTTKQRSKGPVKIGNDVWIGDNVVILSGVTIGDGAIIATGSVVVKDVEPYEIHGGVPAKKIGKRFSQLVINKLLKEKWWTWSNNKIKNSSTFFLNNWNLEIKQ